MLTRGDLAKQFELVVRQEIKNYQDSHNFVLQSIRDLAEEIACAKRDFLQCKAALHSEIFLIKSAISSISTRVLENQEAFKSAQSDQKQVNNDVGKDLQALSNFTHTFELKLDSQEKVNFELLHILNKDHETFMSLHSCTTSSLENIERRLLKEIDKAKEEMKACPSKNSLVKEELEQKIKIQNVDLEGLLKEIKIIGRAVLVTEKKIENIYTLIERMKKSEVTE